MHSWRAMKTIRAGVLGALLLSCIFSGCDLYQLADAIGMCEDRISFGAVSPDERYIATAYHRDCGATTDTTTYVNIRSATAKFVGQGKDVVLAIEWLVPIGLFWTDNVHLSVQAIGCPSKVYRQEMVWHDISISYESFGQIITESR